MNNELKEILKETSTDSIKYWERKRIWYNLFLLLPASLGYFTALEVESNIGDQINHDKVQIITQFFFCFIGANIAFSTAYIPDMFVQLSEFKKTWRQYRAILFILGCIISFPLALQSAAYIVQNF
jgi:hypothetical protein